MWTNRAFACMNFEINIQDGRNGTSKTMKRNWGHETMMNREKIEQRRGYDNIDRWEWCEEREQTCLIPFSLFIFSWFLFPWFDSSSSFFRRCVLHMLNCHLNISLPSLPFPSFILTLLLWEELIFCNFLSSFSFSFSLCLFDFSSSFFNCFSFFNRSWRTFASTGGCCKKINF